MTIMNIPLNRPVVATLAQIDSQERVIAAERVREIERIAARTASAGQLISQAEAMCRESLDDQARAAWAQGVAQGRAEALAKLKDFVDALALRRRELDRELMDLVTDAVGKIIRDMPSDLLAHSVIAHALDAALEHRGRVALRVHPDRVDAAKRATAAHADGQSVQFTVVVTADESFELDDCIAESAFGVIDASLTMQLDSLRSLLRSAV
jgi:type III secretion protein L